MSAFDEMAGSLESAIFSTFADTAVYQPRVGEPIPCRVIVDRDVEVFDPMDVSSAIFRHEAEFLNTEVTPVRGATVKRGTEVWQIGQLLKKTRQTTRVIVLPG